MSLTQDQICCLSIRAGSCIGELGYNIVLKINKGYCVDDLKNKLKHLISLKALLDSKISCGIKTVKNNIINFCNEKVLLSKNNSLFLDNIDSEDCVESELEEVCCIDVCDVESAINSICKNC